MLLSCRQKKKTKGRRRTRRVQTEYLAWARSREEVEEYWRYILFNWNDTDEEMERARQLAVEIGVDRLSWELTDHPETADPRRFVPGSADLASIKREVWDDNGLGNAIPGRRRTRASTSARWSRGFRSWRGPDSRSGCGRASTTCRNVRSPRRPPTAAGSCAWARNSATPQARSSTAISPAHGCRRPWALATR